MDIFKEKFQGFLEEFGKGSVPYMEMMDVEKESYMMEEYKGI